MKNIDVVFASYSGEIEYNANISSLLYYKIGGPVKYLAKPRTKDEIQLLLAIAKENNIPFFILGAGSNVLLSDKGFDGLVIYLGPSPSESYEDLRILREDESEIEVEVPAFFSKAKLLDIALKKSWKGLEFSAGIPGTIGGGVFMNAGTKWGNYAEVITSVDFYSHEKSFYSLSNEEIGFKYRGLGEGVLDGHTLVLAARMKFQKLKDSKELFKLVDEIYSYRGLRQPLELPSCGSVFKNPENSEKGAGRLIEACGLKGLCIGGAEISLKHANFILNKGNAKAIHVYTLIQKIKSRVREKFSITLEPEVVLLGDFKS
jgi:UDP-N-acetylmuramate dehydrogenase